IARPEEQYNHEKDVPIANVPSELVCMWFDECYHPDTDLFQSSFSKFERGELAKFHTYYEKRVDKLPMEEGVGGLQRSPEWQQIQKRAAELLTSLNWDDLAGSGTSDCDGNDRSES